MNIEEIINNEIKSAMLAKNPKRLDALRSIKSVILLLKTSAEGLTEDTLNKALQKEVKKRKESAEIYKTQNRPDLEGEELAQAIVIEEFLPKQMSEDEIKIQLTQLIQSLGAKGPGDMGKVMGAASKAFAGKADNKLVSTLAKQILG